MFIDGGLAPTLLSLGLRPEVMVRRCPRTLAYSDRHVRQRLDRGGGKRGIKLYRGGDPVSLFLAASGLPHRMFPVCFRVFLRLSAGVEWRWGVGSFFLQLGSNGGKGIGRKGPHVVGPSPAWLSEFSHPVKVTRWPVCLTFVDENAHMGPRFFCPFV